jgi:hypothetical protein
MQCGINFIQLISYMLHITSISPQAGQLTVQHYLPTSIRQPSTTASRQFLRNSTFPYLKENLSLLRILEITTKIAFFYSFNL